MQANLRPLSFGEILDGAFTLYRRNFASFAATALASAAGLLVLVALLGIGAVFLVPLLMGSTVLMVLAALLGLIAIMAMGMLMWGALAWRAAQAYTGRPTTLGESLLTGGRSAMKLVGVAVAAVLLCLVGIWAVLRAVEGAVFLLGSAGGTVVQVLLVVVGLAGVLGVLAVVMASLFATLPAVVLEEKGPVQAVSRSFSLVEGSLWRVAGVLLVAMLIASLPGVAVVWATGGFQALYDPASAAVNAAMEPMSRQIIEQLLSALVNVFTTPFLVAVIVLLYYDRRVRTEALDVRMAADRLAVAGD
ncbi:MAG TPA: hypothetical protein VFR37_17510 [Longimicrobium sp.]|nr:hypothetical protein [Longimicrobium sp.]